MADSEILIGISGVAVGALMTGGVDAVSRLNARKLAKRTAARVIYGDLFGAQDSLNTALELGEWGTLPPFSFGDWQRYRDTLSAGMRAGGFHRVSGAYYGLSTLQLHRGTDPDFFPVKSAEDGLLQVTKALSLIFDEGTSYRDVRRMAWGASRIGLAELEPGAACLVRHEGDIEVAACYIGPAPPVIEDDSEVAMARVELNEVRIAVRVDALAPLT